MVKQRWGCIYKLTNTVNNKKYIGKTVHFKRRMSQHKTSKKKTYFYNAIRKYGWDNFEQEILVADVPEEDLDNLEIHYIDIHDSTNPKKGYNLTKGGEGTTGRVVTDETRKKQSMANKKHSAGLGSISFEKRRKNHPWCVRSCGRAKFIGYYNTRERALEALNKYNATGERMESDTIKRKKGTGCVSYHKATKKWMAKTTASKNASPQRLIGQYNTREKALQAVELFRSTGKRMDPDIDRRKGSVLLTKGKYQAMYKRKYLGRFKTKELAEEAIKQYIKNIN